MTTTWDFLKGDVASNDGSQGSQVGILEGPSGNLRFADWLFRSKGGASYGWWAGFLHNFVIPNSSWIAKLVTLSELAIGALLILGLFTGAAAFAGIGLNLIYMFSGSSGVNPAYAIVSLFLILAWRNAGYFGLDRFALPAVRDLMHHGSHTKEAVAKPPTVPVPIPVH